MNTSAIIKFLDNYLETNSLTSLNAVESNALLEKANLLPDSKDRPGKPLRDLLRKGLIPHAYQTTSRNWVIPRQSDQKQHKSVPSSESKLQPQTKKEHIENFLRLKTCIENAREAYKPDNIKCLLVAEAPPDAVERFFYYHDVKVADYLFLGVSGCLYPELKLDYLNSGRSSVLKEKILRQFQEDGFYLIDLCELPISLEPISQQHIQQVVPRIQALRNEGTKIILIKANVYDICYPTLFQALGKGVLNSKIPFPSTGNQLRFHKAFKTAIEQAGL
jgi:hypothetical protein